VSGVAWHATRVFFGFDPAFIFFGFGDMAEI
jgi:hypothetical protein